MKFFAIIAVSLLAVAQSSPSAYHFESGNENTPLLELFTSEGCSSCPPAEEWLSDFRKDSGLWTKAVPVAWHVDYWNDLGWPDPYSSHEATIREQNYAQMWGTGSVCTPQFVLNGHAWHPSQGFTPVHASGSLALRVSVDGSVEITFRPEVNQRGPWIASVVPMSCGLVQTVPRGENAGRTLRHEFVSLGILKAHLAPQGDNQDSAQIVIPTDVLTRADAIAAWVSCDGRQTPVQSVGGWLK